MFFDRVSIYEITFYRIDTVLISGTFQQVFGINSDDRFFL
jgi:hypothetical protein